MRLSYFGFALATLIALSCCAWAGATIWSVFHPGGSGEWMALLIGSVYITSIPGGILVTVLAVINKHRTLRNIAFGLAAVTLSMSLLTNLAVKKYSADRQRANEEYLKWGIHRTR